MRRHLLSLVVGVALVAAACGVSTSSAVDRTDDVPFGLTDADSANRTGPDSGNPIDLYLYDAPSGRLIRLASSSETADLNDVVTSLQEGGVIEGSPSGNPLAGADVVRSVDLSRGLATVDLSEAFTDLSGSNQLIALAEIVYTATARPGVGQVLFTIEGEPTEIPRGDGSLSSEAVTRADYAAFAPVS